MVSGLLLQSCSQFYGAFPPKKGSPCSGPYNQVNNMLVSKLGSHLGPDNGNYHVGFKARPPHSPSLRWHASQSCGPPLTVGSGPFRGSSLSLGILASRHWESRCISALDIGLGHFVRIGAARV